MARGDPSPIGRSHRKGPNNTLDAGPDDPGSPWAIGGPEGGHLDIAPELGTLGHFKAVVARAHELAARIDAEVRVAGFEFCAVDLQGFRSGRMNVLLGIPAPGGPAAAS